ncbi:MAG: phage tail tape measure protein, partial [Actinoplanes sp.]
MARTVSVKLVADIGQYTQNMRRATTETRSLSSEIDKAAKGGRLDEVTNMATGLGLGLVGAAAVAVKFSMDFEKQMSNVKAATHASTAEIDKLKAASLQAGKDTAFSATEAAKGVEELAKAGVSTGDILGGGLKGALDLAAAGELGVGEAAETAASALTQFKLKGKDVPHVADLLSAAAGKAQGSVHDMGQALNQAGLVASQTGLTIEETTGTLAAFANAGLIGSDAGTSFKQMLLMLQAPSGKTKDLMDDLGISAYDASGQFIGITALAGQLKAQLSKLTPEVRANAMAQIFGADATRAASILYEQGQDGIQGWIDKTNDSGYAAETAAIKTDNLAGDLERLKGSLETAAIESGGGLNQGLRVLTKAADGLVTALDD